MSDFELFLEDINQIFNEQGHITPKQFKQLIDLYRGARIYIPDRKLKNKEITQWCRARLDAGNSRTEITKRVCDLFGVSVGTAYNRIQEALNERLPQKNEKRTIGVKTDESKQQRLDT